MFVSINDVGVFFTSSSILRLVRGCPKLCNVAWDYWKDPPWSAIRDGDNADELNNSSRSELSGSILIPIGSSMRSMGFGTEYGPENGHIDPTLIPASWEARVQWAFGLCSSRRRLLAP